MSAQDVTPNLKAPRRSRSEKRGWQKVRKLVEGRAGGWCEADTPDCPEGRHVGYHAHHVRLRAQGGMDDVGNLLWVCPAAHRYIHDHPAESYERGWLQRTEAS